MKTNNPVKPITNGKVTNGIQFCGAGGSPLNTANSAKAERSIKGDLAEAALFNIWVIRSSLPEFEFILKMEKDSVVQ